MKKITNLEVKSHVFQHQKEIKEMTLYIRILKFEAEDKLHTENMEKEVRQQVIEPSTLALQSKEKGKAVIETNGSG